MIISPAVPIRTAAERRASSVAPAAAAATTIIVLVAGACASTPAPAGDAGEPSQWEDEIRAYEAADRMQPPVPGGVVFVGSSSIRMWESLQDDFEGIDVVNRGFGGSQMSDALHFADRIILPYRPEMVVVYAGDNDLWAGETPQTVFEEFQALVERIQSELPETRVAFIAVKPSTARWRIADLIRQTNDLVESYAEQHPLVEYIDVFTPMLADDGSPRAELFIEDGLHLNEAGYELWESVVEPVVRRGISWREPGSAFARR